MIKAAVGGKFSRLARSVALVLDDGHRANRGGMWPYRIYPWQHRPGIRVREAELGFEIRLLRCSVSGDGDRGEGANFRLEVVFAHLP